MSAAAILPFLAALKRQSQIVPTPDVSTGNPTPPPGGEDAAAAPNAPAMPPPDLSVGQPQQPPPPPPDPVGDIAQGMIASQGQPQLAGETKGHKLMRILMAGAQGGAVGAGQRTFGEGFQQGNQLPFQQKSRNLNLQQQQAQTDLTKAQAGQVTIMGPNGQPMMLPAFLAKGALGASIGANAKTQAAETAAGAHVQGAKIGANSRVEAAQINQGQAIPVDETVANLAGFPELAGQPVGKSTWANINKAINSRGYQMKDLGNDGMWLMDRAGSKIKRISDSPSLQRAVAGAQARPVQAADENDPGVVRYMPAGKAMQTGALSPQSAGTVTAKVAAKAEVPTKIGDQKVAFTTMIQHADLLRRAAKDLNNGDTQSLNGLENAFKNEFGYSGPITASAIADAYKGEVSNVINKGHITDQGNEKIAHTLDPTKQNFATMDSVLGAYQSLAQSKMNMLNKQEQDAINNSKPNKGNAGKKGDPLGIL